jgi:hypothetical protein
MLPCETTMRGSIALIGVVAFVSAAGAAAVSAATSRHAAASCVRLAPLSAAGETQLATEADWIGETTGDGGLHMSFSDPASDQTRVIFYADGATNTVVSEIETIGRGSNPVVTAVTYGNRTWTTDNSQSASASWLRLSPLACRSTSGH